MKTFLPAIAGLLCIVAASQADVFVYRNKLSYTVTGGGGSTRNSVGGWAIIDDSANVAQVQAFTAQKKYAIVPMQSIEYGTADAGAGRQCSFFVQRDVWTDGDGHTHTDTGGAKGLDVVTTVNGHQWNVPKTFLWAGRSSYPASSAGGWKYEESSGTMSFDANWTSTCNTAGDNIN